MTETIIKIFSYCCFCWYATDQVFIRDEGIYEVYKCEQCQHEHRIAVR